MPKILWLLISLTLAAPPALAAPDKLGKRTAPPEKSFAGIGEGSADAALEAEIAAASAFPLGSLQNPVRVEGPDGARAYVARLRCADGKAPAAAAGRPGGTGAFGSVTELVALDCGAAAPDRAEIRFDLYHEGHVEDRAPTGFTLAPR
ncbi:MAG: hypothetical protein ACJ8EB_14500 [Allosphingosinicella sp.]